MKPSKSLKTYEVELAEGAFDIESPDEQGYEKMKFYTSNHIFNSTRFKELAKDVIWEITMEERNLRNGKVVSPARAIKTAREYSRADFERGD